MSGEKKMPAPLQAASGKKQMTYQRVPDSGLLGEAGASLLPPGAVTALPTKSGVDVTISAEYSAAFVLLCPDGKGLTPGERKQIVNTNDIVGIGLAAKHNAVAQPADYHNATMMWAFNRANRIIVWPTGRENERAAAVAQAIVAGVRFLVTIETSLAEVLALSAGREGERHVGATPVVIIKPTVVS